MSLRLPYIHGNLTYADIQLLESGNGQGYSFPIYNGIAPPISCTSIEAGNNSVPGSFGICFSSGVLGGYPPYSYLWNFGDGTNSTAMWPVHIYRQDGSYLVTLKVTDATGNVTNSTGMITYDRLPPPPLTLFGIVTLDDPYHRDPGPSDSSDLHCPDKKASTEGRR